MYVLLTAFKFLHILFELCQKMKKISTLKHEGSGAFISKSTRKAFF
jgi:hypothetical protein